MHTTSCNNSIVNIVIDCGSVAVLKFGHPLKVDELSARANLAVYCTDVILEAAKFGISLADKDSLALGTVPLAKSEASRLLS